MKMSIGKGLVRLAVSVSAFSMMGGIAVTPLEAQSRTVTVPALPLAEALQRIQAITGTKINYDPDAVRGATSVPVAGARDAEAAVRKATSTAPVSVRRERDGSIVVVNDIVVVARRDEAETSLLVRNATTSTRTGQSLREQPRNTQVISSRLMAEQQAQTVVDALRNAGGVSVNTATVQGGVTYSVRGFGASGVVNGLPAANSGGFAAGTTQPVANVERLEVLKGPDAILAGADSLGGTVNIVTKKPSAEPRLYVSAETGSFGAVRGTIDANTPLNTSRTVSARIIATAASADRNYGGYRPDEDYLYAPSVRFKNANTDVIAGLTLSNQIFGATPYLPLNPITKALFDLPADRPVLGRAEQGIQVTSTIAYGEATQKVADWLTLVGRGQHQKLNLRVGQYSPFAVFDGAGTVLVSNSRSQQTGNSDAVDGYAKLHGKILGMDHTLVAGYTYVENDMTAFSSSGSSFFTYNILKPTGLPTPLASVNTKDYTLSSHQNGYYAQYLLKVWKLAFLAGARHNVFESTISTFFRPRTTTDRGSATTPNFGAVFDVTPSISLFGTLAYGYSPTFVIGRDGQKLPDIKTRNAEAGVKLDLLNKKMLINASVFKLRQSNLTIQDPTDFLFPIAVPGQQGTGIDLNLSGQLTSELTLQASYTRTKYEFLTFSQFGNVVVAQPKDRYSAYGSYRHKFDEDLTAGLGVGVFGRSSASVNRTGSYYVPPAFQIDLNSFLKVGRLDVNLGLRNALNRRNYNITYAASYIPVSEPRNWRLTVGYRFK